MIRIRPGLLCRVMGFPKLLPRYALLRVEKHISQSLKPARELYRNWRITGRLLSSLSPQGNHGIDGCRASRGKVARQRGDGTDSESPSGHRECVRGQYAEQLGLYQPRYRECAV